MLKQLLCTAAAALLLTGCSSTAKNPDTETQTAAAASAAAQTAGTAAQTAAVTAETGSDTAESTAAPSAGSSSAAAQTAAETPAANPADYADAAAAAEEYIQGMKTHSPDRIYAASNLRLEFQYEADDIVSEDDLVEEFAETLKYADWSACEAGDITQGSSIPAIREKLTAAKAEAERTGSSTELARLSGLLSYAERITDSVQIAVNGSKNNKVLTVICIDGKWITDVYLTARREAELGVQAT